MASIISGFEYDIFISYRQKDNKHDGWVTVFVENLKDEIEATFKEEISIYFDINPHDGLLETHDVDASLGNKLRCLVFIPIISRTYCDQKSFAWEHEFKVFIRQASSDRFGMKVGLPNGNVATRVLPVKIHDLDPSDNDICEQTLGSVLRGVDFIFRSAGVNRPLRMIEDSPKDNLNKTYYRDQINKVANAVREIIEGLKAVESGHKLLHEKVKKLTRVKARNEINEKMPVKRVLIIAGILFCLLISVLGYTKLRSVRSEKSIALIPLSILTDENKIANEASSFVEFMNDRLRTVRRIAIIPSMQQYKDNGKSNEQIMKEINADYYIYGNIRNKDGKPDIWIALSTPHKVLWTGRFIWDKDEISSISREVIQTVAGFMDLKLTQEELLQIGKEPTKNADANMSYISANALLNDGRFYYSYEMEDSTSFISAIKSYDKAIRLDTMFAQAYAMRSIAASWGFFTKQLDSSYIKRCRDDIDKTIAINKDLPVIDIARGFYYYYCTNEYETALGYFKSASEKFPDDYQPLLYMSLVYRRMGDWKSVRSLLSRVVEYNPREALFLTNIGISYQYLHLQDSALIYHQKAIEMMPGWAGAYANKIQTLIQSDKNSRAIWKAIEEGKKNTGKKFTERRIMLHLIDRNYESALSVVENSNQDDFSDPGILYLYKAQIFNGMNKPELALINYDSSRTVFERSLLNDKDNYFIHSLLGIAYAGIGNKTRALDEGTRSISLAKKNGMDFCDMRVNMAQIYTMTGDFGRAISEIESLLSGPSQLTVNVLRRDPVWQSLMNVSEFKDILKKYSLK
jgi:tetratricopeptide (TPR) repeat protein